MNYSQIALELLRLAAYLALSFVMFGYIIKVNLQEHGADYVRQALQMDQKQFAQLKSVNKRAQNKADQLVAKDLIEHSPLSAALGLLTEETRAYLIQHPETLPGLLQNYAGPLDIGLKLLPQLTALFPGLKDQLQKAAPSAKFDY